MSLSGFFSKLLNARFSEDVETHNLLGECQNGFCKGLRMADNSFILDSILMKAKSDNKNLHLCYVDISKAYYSVNQSILRAKLASLGFGGEFRGCLKALYCNDGVDSVVNGMSTRPARAVLCLLFSLPSTSLRLVRTSPSLMRVISLGV